jgi:hypothetical protein
MNALDPKTVAGILGGEVISRNLTTGRQKAMRILDSDLVGERGENEIWASTPCKVRMRRLGVALNQNELGSLAGHRQYEAAEFAGCMVLAAEAR